MKVFLPFIIIASVLLMILSPGVQSLSGRGDLAAAQGVTPTPGAAAGTGLGVGEAAPPDGTWVKDPDVTFVGKTAARSGSFLDWSLANYNWVSLGTSETNPLVDFWRTVRNIVYAFFSLFVLITAFVIMITRGKNITVMRFIPRFIGIILLVTFSFALVQFLYQVFDIIQGFFLRNPDCYGVDPATIPAFCGVNDKISQANLLNVGFSYIDFIGYRQAGMGNDEAAMITLLLTKLTAITYYVMVGVLIVRKIILWFFIIISPIFPLLLLYRPVRNTGKIWVGEFFRWLLYAPLFSVLLAGLVSLWRAGIPLFSYNASGDIVSKAGNVGVDVVYPTAINILLGGPKANISLQNSINLPETFALYVICLIMLWVVIILPFILLRIFLDYIFSVSLAENNSLKQVMSMANSFINKPPAGPSPVGPLPPPAGAGLARALPFTKRFSMPEGVAQTLSTNTDRAAVITRNTTTQTKTTTGVPTTTSRVTDTFTNRTQLRSVKETSEITKLTNLSVPTMRDIAKYETAQLSSNTMQKSQVSQINQSLQHIANPTQTMTPVEREKYVQVREKLVTESQKGNVLATTILNAANTMSHTSITNHASTNNAVVKTVFKQLANPERIANPAERDQYTQVKGKIVQENQNGNQVAASLLAYINNLSENNVTSPQTISVENIQKFLKNVSAPVSITDNSTKNTYVQLRDQLQTQSKQGNTLATSILSLSNGGNTANAEQLAQLKEQLATAQKSGDPLATSILSNVQKETGELDVDKVREKLTQAKANGDKVASVLLSLVDAKQQTGKTNTTSPSLPVVNRLQTVSLDDYEAVKKTWRESYKNVEVPQKLDKVQTRGEWIKSDINQISSTITLLSSPDAEKRAEGMKEVSSILPFLLIGGFSQTEIIAYLKAKLEAAKDVSGEIDEKDQEEGSLMDAKRQTASRPQSMHMTAEAKVPETGRNMSSINKQTNTTTNTTSSSSSSDSEEETSSVLRSAAQTASIQTPISTTPVVSSAQSNTATVVSSPSISQPMQPSTTMTFNTQILQLTNLSVPTMKDIARFETAHLTNTVKENPDVVNMQRSLTTIAQPASATSPAEQQQFQSIREKLVAESQKGDFLATSILNAANTISSSSQQRTASSEITDAVISTLITKLAHTEGIPSLEEKRKYVAVKEQLLKAKEQDNPLAIDVSNVIDHPEQTDKVSQVKEKLIAERQKGNPLAVATLSLAPSQTTTNRPIAAQASLPPTNRIQSVSVEDYEAVKKIWKDNYKSVPVPQINGNSLTRSEWVAKDTQEIMNTISQLSSTDREQQEEGMKKVSEILPFLLIGGFSQTEVVTYMKAKLEAAKDTATELSEKQIEDDTFLTTEKRSDNQAQPLRMAADVTVPSGGAITSNLADTKVYNSVVANNATIQQGNVTSSQSMTQNVLSPVQSSNNSSLLTLTSLSVPTMKDIARFETAHLEKHLERTPEVEQMKDSLQRIASPTLEREAVGQQRYQQMRTKLMDESKRGDVLATSILAAAESIDTKKSQSLTAEDIQVILTKLHAPDDIQDAGDRQHVIEVRNQLMEEKNKGNNLATSIISTATEPQPQTPEVINALLEDMSKAENKDNPVISLLISILPPKRENAEMQTLQLPSANRVQTVSVEDYEAVKQIWKDSYKTVAYPQIDGKLTDRKQWIQKDMDEITATIALLSNTDLEKQRTGMKKVSEILPFLLIGGFSQSEVITYLKAKSEAAKEVITSIMQKEEDEGSMLDRSTTIDEKQGLHEAVSLNQSDDTKRENT